MGMIDSTRPIVIGLGTGRCGTLSLSRLLNAQPSSAVTHEHAPPLSWTADESAVRARLAVVAARQGELVGDVAHPYLPHARLLLEVHPGVVCVALRRDRQQTIESFERKSGRWNHWQQHDGRTWGHQPTWDQCFPKYEAASRADAIGMYWDEYYARCEALCAEYPGRVFLLEIDALNSLHGVETILAHCRVTKMNRRVGIRENVWPAGQSQTQVMPVPQAKAVAPTPAPAPTRAANPVAARAPRGTYHTVGNAAFPTTPRGPTAHKKGVSVSGHRGARAQRSVPRFNVNETRGGKHEKTFDNRECFDKERTAYEAMKGCGGVPAVLAVNEAQMKITLRAEGTNLEQYRGPFNNVLGQSIFNAVAAMHARGIAHRDLHIRNVLIAARGALVIDFEWSHGHYCRLEHSPDLVGGVSPPLYYSTDVPARYWDDPEKTSLSRRFGPWRPFYEQYLKDLRTEFTRITGYKPSKTFNREGRVYQSLPQLGIPDSAAQRKTGARIARLGLASLVSGAAVLDLGANVGAMSMACAELGATKVEAVELDPARCDFARRVAAVAGLHDRVTFEAKDIMRTLRERQGAPYEGVVLALAVDAHMPSADEFYRLLIGMQPSTVILESNKHLTPAPLEAIFGPHFSTFEVLGSTKDEDAFGTDRMIVRMRK